MDRIKTTLLLILLPLILALAVLFLGEDSWKASLFIALPWYFLIQGKGYPLIANTLLLLASLLFLLIPDISLAFLAALALLSLPSLLLPSKYRLKEIWLLSSGGNGVFSYNFRRN